MPPYGQRNLNLHGTTHRHPRHPVIYEAFNHPLHPMSNPGRTYVIYILPTVAAMSEALDFEKVTSIPKGRKEALDFQGWFELAPGDYLFGRNKLGSAEEEDDTPLAWVVDGNLNTPETLERLDKATIRALGPEHLRTTSEVFMEKYCEPVKKDTRCYSICTTYEKPRNIVTPAANVKQMAGTQIFCELSRDLASAIIPVAMESMKHAPETVRRQLKERADSLIMARVGTHENYAYQSIQCNIASVSHDSSGSLEQQMGFFGGPHFDEHDSPAHYTNMIANSQLPPGYDEGYFFLIGVGVYFRLKNHVGLNFQGNRRHGGTGPFPPEGVVPISSAYRFTMISYPPESMSSRDSRMRLGASSKGATFLTPEMRKWKYDPSNKEQNNYPQFLRDGSAFMDNQSIAELTSYSMMEFARYYANSVPDGIGLDIDTDKFTSSFSYLDENGCRQPVAPWKKAPPVYQHGASFDKKEAEYEREESVWDEYLVLTAGLTPARLMGSLDLQRKICLYSNMSKENRRRPTEGGRAERNYDGATREDEVADDAAERDNRGRPRSTVPGINLPPDSMNELSRSTRHRSRSFDHTMYSATKRPRYIMDCVAITSTRGPRPSSSPSSQRQIRDDTEIHSDRNRPNQEPSKRNKGKTKGRTRSGKGGKGMEKMKAAGGNRPHVFAFIQSTTAHVLELELLQLKLDMTLEEVNVMPEDIERLTGTIHEACATLNDDLSSSAAVGHILTFSKFMENMPRLNNLAMRNARLATAIANTRVWKWLDTDLPKAVILELEKQQALPAEGIVQKWFPNLVRQAHGFHLHRLPHFSFHSTQIGFHSIKTDNKVVHIRGRPLMLAGDQLKQAVVHTVHAVVAGWIGYELDWKRKRAWFVSIIIDALGEEALTMDYVWAMFVHFKLTYVLEGRHGYRAKDISSANAFQSAVMENPIMKKGSTEYSLYSQYKELLKGTLDPLMVEVGGRQGPIWLRYAHMWRIALDYFKLQPTENPTSAMSTDKYFLLLKSDPDFFSPIREKAPARVRSMAVGGPYHPHVVRTKAGIFSALVWRGITYRSEFYNNNPMVYISWPNLLETVNHIISQSKDKDFSIESEYFCKRNAYGQPAQNREMACAEKFWESVSQKGWEDFASANLVPDRVPNFMATIQHFRLTGAEADIFPQLGPLGCFALVCDLAVAGVCHMPTVEEMAACIVSLSKGALGGLWLLGLVPKTLPKKKADSVLMVVEALIDLNGMMVENFTEQERTEMGYNLIVLEHSLCKFSRLTKRNVL